MGAPIETGKKQSHREPAPSNLSAAQGTGSFDWPLATEAEQLLRGQIEKFLAQNSFARELSRRMAEEAGTDFFEWIDHFILPANFETALRSAGFARDQKSDTPNGEIVLEHPRATLPRVLLGSAQSQVVIALRPEFVADFAGCHHLRVQIEGEPCSRYRRIIVATENGTQLEAVERRAYRGFVAAPPGADELSAVVRARELWRTRPRLFEHDAEGFRVANQRLGEVIELVGQDMACQFFFEAERAYWERRNRAGRLQKHRQDQLGLGWGNHDHHTFRCSREHFVDVVQFLVRLGFTKRERYYAGAEAGWGAQILEQETTGIVVFSDVDLMPDETEIDFASDRLPPAPRLATVGLWVGLHGESFLEAGMHHLEARFEFALLREQLQECGIALMKPFSDFDFLRQAFTEGERWPVRRERLKRLATAKLITPEQEEKFREEGALGSHLENLQRHGGFKGFNQKSVSVVIAATDPRKQHFAHANLLA